MAATFHTPGWCRWCWGALPEDRAHRLYCGERCARSAHLYQHREASRRYREAKQRLARATSGRASP